MIKPQIHTNSIRFISLKSLHRYDIDICNRYISTISLQKSMCFTNWYTCFCWATPGGGLFPQISQTNLLRVESPMRMACGSPLGTGRTSTGFFTIFGRFLIGKSSLNWSKMMMFLSRNIEWFYPFTWSFWRLIDWFCACDRGLFSDWQHS